MDELVSEPLARLPMEERSSELISNTLVTPITATHLRETNNIIHMLQEEILSQRRQREPEILYLWENYLRFRALGNLDG